MDGGSGDERRRRGGRPATADDATVEVPVQRPTPAGAPTPPPLPGPRRAGPDEAVTERLAPVRPDPAPGGAPGGMPDAAPARAADGGPGRPRGAAGSGRPRRARRRADLAVAGGGLLALLGFLLAPHTTTPDTGPLTLPALIALTEAREPAVGVLRLVGAGAAVVALAGATAAALRGRWWRTALHAGALTVAALLLLGYALVGLAVLRGGTPTIVPGAAVVALGLLLAFVGAVAALAGPR
jgi:hypothetical protein